MHIRQLNGKSLSLSAAERHDRICDRLEAGWQAGNPPRIENLLTEVPASERAILFVALLGVELDLRNDVQTGPDEYRVRFPEFAELIDCLYNGQAQTGLFVESIDDAFKPPSIAGYEVAGTLGHGGMGVVFKALHIGLNRPVAIKMIRTAAGNPNQLVRFQLEARSIAGLSHPNIVPLYDFGQSDGRPYLVLEFVEGGSLADRLDGKPADPEWSAGLVEQLARAVHHIHDRRIIHRDLKPANILLTQDGTPKITDFGLAKWLTDDDPGLTKTYAVLGTACYMSPEQASGGSKSVGPGTDVYALGGILYECLTGRLRFRAATYAATLDLVLKEEPPRPTELIQSLPADLEAICLKCLEKELDRRYSAAELAEDLACYRQRLPVSARPVDISCRHARWAQRIGYKLGDLLDANCWEYTYVARQEAIHRTVQLKLSAGTAGSPAHAALKRQADALADLDHPNVIQLYDYDEKFGQPYLVLGYVEGGELVGRRSKGVEKVRAPLPTRQSAELALMMAMGLQAIHDHGVLHGGLHTDAVIVTPDGTPKIGSFTAARKQNQPDETAAMPPDWVPSSFQPPEAHAGTVCRIGPAYDIYALGAMLYDLLTGAPPGIGKRLTAPAGADPDFSEIVMKCLEPEPEQRYQSAGKLAFAVQMFLTPVPPRTPESTEDSTCTIMPPDNAPADRSARHQLRIAIGPRSIGRTFEVPRYRVMIGRSKKNNVALEGDKVSRVHCGIIWNDMDGCHELVDLGAHNGTFVNDLPVKSRRRLVVGDRIRIADYTLLYEPLPTGTESS